MKQVLLGDLVKIIGGGTPSRSKPEYYNGSIPWITVKDFGDELFLRKSKETITEQGLEESATNLIPAGNVILITRMAVGKVAINLVDVAINQDLKALICKPGLEPKYLLFFLLSQKDELESQADGATVKGITIESVNKLKMSLPPLAEQKRIAAIAQKADRLRRTRRYTLQLSDTYLQSVFLEMFGDARTNPNNFPTEPLGDSLQKFESGVNFNPVSEREPASQWRVLKVSAVTSGVFEPYESKPIKPDVTFNDTLVVKKGDLLMSRANTRELVGAICMVREQPPKVLLPDKLWRVKFSKHSNLEPNYVLYALRQPKLRKIIADMASGTSGSMKNISKEQAATLPVLIPPFALQEKFSQIVQKFERFRTQQREAERQAEHLFQTLLHRAFRCELTPQDSNDEPASVFLEEIGAEQAQAEAEAKAATQAMSDAAEYLGTKAKQQNADPIQLKLPGIE